MIELYHGSNVSVHFPEIIKPKKTLDFGKGFYTTSSLEQATKWAVNKTKIIGSGHPFVSVFSVPDNYLSDSELRVLDFPKANEEWLDFVIANRTNPSFTFNYDIVRGAVANDRVYASINAYESGFMNKKDLLRELRTWVYTDQILFHTEKALKILSFIKDIEL